MNKDQYGNAVPADLMLLPDFDLLDDTQRMRVTDADWYEANGILLTSAGAFGDLTDIGGVNDPRDADLDVDADGNIVGCPIIKIDDPLKRGNHEDGWYHA